MPSPHAPGVWGRDYSVATTYSIYAVVKIPFAILRVKLLMESSGMYVLLDAVENSIAVALQANVIWSILAHTKEESTTKIKYNAAHCR